MTQWLEVCSVKTLNSVFQQTVHTQTRAHSLPYLCDAVFVVLVAEG